MFGLRQLDAVDVVGVSLVRNFDERSSCRMPPNGGSVDGILLTEAEGRVGCRNDG